MSLPFLPPGAGDAKSGDGILLEEKKRHWWTPIAATSDRWFQPRWRALLTWVALAAVCARKAADLSVSAPIDSVGNPDLLTRFFDSLPGAANTEVWWLWWAASMFFLMCWFQPFALGIGIWRGFVWMLASVGLGMTELVINHHPALMRLLVSAHFFGIPAFAAVLGQRSRPWMAFVGAALAAAVSSSVDNFIPTSVSLRWWVLSNLVYGGVMLYGTSPLPRKEGTR